MKPPSICHAKETGSLSGGKNRRQDAASGSDLTDAESTFSQSIEDCPFGARVRVRSAEGEQALAIRSEYHPYWLDENRDQPLLFNPTEWQIAPSVG